MKVKELIALLEKMDPDRLVILQKDGEGNGYAPCEGADDNCRYEPYGKWYGGLGMDHLTPENIADGYTDLDVSKGEPAMVLYPVN